MKNSIKKPFMILMAIVQNPITGRSRKKFANAVFSEIFGKNIIRAKPLKVRNPKTTKQENQRTKFKLIVKTSRSVLALICYSFKNMAKGKSAFNAFMEANIKTAITGSTGNWSINYNNLMVANGPAIPPQSLTASVDMAAKIKRTWQIPIDPTDVTNTDLLYYAVYNSVVNEWYYGPSTTARSVGIDEQPVPTSWSGNKVFVYSFFVTADGSQCSQSVCSGSVTLM
jgi:hypothetical protein